jgi:hypothetical protein
MHACICIQLSSSARAFDGGLGRLLWATRSLTLVLLLLQVGGLLCPLCPVCDEIVSTLMRSSEMGIGWLVCAHACEWAQIRSSMANAAGISNPPNNGPNRQQGRAGTSTKLTSRRILLHLGRRSRDQRTKAGRWRRHGSSSGSGSGGGARARFGRTRTCGSACGGRYRRRRRRPSAAACAFSRGKRREGKVTDGMSGKIDRMHASVGGAIDRYVPQSIDQGIDPSNR